MISGNRLIGFCCLLYDLRKSSYQILLFTSNLLAAALSENLRISIVYLLLNLKNTLYEFSSCVAL
jgi:hypothetical protein